MKDPGSVRRVSRAGAKRYLLKAREHLATAEDGLIAGRWTTAGINAIQAGINAADAALAASAGIRSASQDHGSVVGLLATWVTDFPATQRRHIGGLLAQRNSVAYDDRLLTEVEARQLVDHASRFVGWVADVVGRSSGQ